MTMQLHNTLTRKKDAFVPIDPANVRLYVCGPTVYDRIHIGNARPLVVFDTLYRMLRHRYGVGHVRYVRNITDIDDKINARAAERGEPIATLTTRTAQLFHEDAAALGTLVPDVEPRATDHIAQMLALIQSLVAQGHAYEAEGHVLFNVPSMPDYGSLSGRSQDEMIAGARVEVAPYKRHPADFVLWKPSPPELPGWDSLWGRGRPGWHIECSAMSAEYLGETFDIHGGGQDLIFPHHENELAQSACAHHAPIANYWMHNGFINMAGEKMAKSLGNVVQVHQLLDQAPGEAVRFALLSAHYHQPMDWSDDTLRHAKGTMDRFYQALRLAPTPAEESEPPEGFVAALEDDLNTPQALALLHEAAAALNKASSPSETAKRRGALLAAGGLLGLFAQEPEQWFRWAPKGVAGMGDDRIAALVEERIAARKSRDFATADRIRQELTEAGVTLEDGPAGTTWRRG